MKHWAVWTMILTLGPASLWGQADPAPAKDPGVEAAPAPQVEGLQTREQPAKDSIVVPRGTRVPLVLINSISTKNSAPGDLVYLESVYPVVVRGRILIPPGTYVSGTVTHVKRPGRIKGKGELFLRFDNMILPNGTIRDFTARIGALDGRSPEGFDRDEGKITSEPDKGGDAGTVAQTTAAGTSVGAIAGAVGDRAGMGIGIGAAAGAAAGLATILATRGPEALLEKGTQLDMVLDRDLYFTEAEVTFDNPLQRPSVNVNVGTGPDPNRNRGNTNSGGLGRFPPF